MAKKSDIKPGDKIGTWEVIRQDHREGDRNAHYLCRCTKCGNEKRIRSTRLRHKEINCSCKIITVGMVIGHWKVVSPEYRVKNVPYHKCWCDCGNVREVLAKNLRSGRSKSCGCAQLHPLPINFEGYDEKEVLTDLQKLKTDQLKEKYSCCIKTIKKALHYFGIDKKSKSRIDTEKLIALQNAGKTVREITEELSDTYSNVYARLVFLGYTPNVDNHAQTSVAALESAERDTKAGFRFYWSARPWYFEDLYGLQYTDENAAKVFESLLEEVA